MWNVSRIIIKYLRPSPSFKQDLFCSNTWEKIGGLLLLNEQSFIEGYVQFTPVPVKPFSDQKCVRYRRFPS